MTKTRCDYCDDVVPVRCATCGRWPRADGTHEHPFDGYHYEQDEITGELMRIPCIENRP